VQPVHDWGTEGQDRTGQDRTRQAEGGEGTLARFTAGTSPPVQNPLLDDEPSWMHSGHNGKERDRKARHPLGGSPTEPQGPSLTGEGDAVHPSQSGRMDRHCKTSAIASHHLGRNHAAQTQNWRRSLWTRDRLRGGSPKPRGSDRGS